MVKKFEFQQIGDYSHDPEGGGIRVVIKRKLTQSENYRTSRLYYRTGACRRGKRGISDSERMAGKTQII
jgi:hypothetical protein